MLKCAVEDQHGGIPGWRWAVGAAVQHCVGVDHQETDAAGRHEKNGTHYQLPAFRLRGRHRLDCKKSPRPERVLHPAGEGSQRSRT